MAYDIVITDLAVDELEAIRVFDRRRIVGKIKEQLLHQPGVETRNRKPLPSFEPEFEHDPPVWELRVGEFRVFYDFDEKDLKVNVRAVRRKEHGDLTEEIA